MSEHSLRNPRLAMLCDGGMVTYTIRAALADETNNGWVWLCGPSTKAFESRTVVKMRFTGRCHGVYAEVRMIDDNFIERYNEGRRVCIDKCRDTIVMSEWYRRSLGIHGTTNTDGIPLIVKKARIWGWRSVRAICHHPDPVVRIGARLGILSVWLGLLGVWLGLLGAHILSSNVCPLRFEFLVLLIILAVCVWACLGPPRPQLA